LRASSHGSAPEHSDHRSLHSLASDTNVSPEVVAVSSENWSDARVAPASSGGGHFSENGDSAQSMSPTASKAFQDFLQARRASSRKAPQRFVSVASHPSLGCTLPSAPVPKDVVPVASAASLTKLASAPAPNDVADRVSQMLVEASACNASNAALLGVVGQTPQALAEASNAVLSVAHAPTSPALVSPSAMSLLSSCESTKSPAALGDLGLVAGESLSGSSLQGPRRASTTSTPKLRLTKRKMAKKATGLSLLHKDGQEDNGAGSPQNDDKSTARTVDVALDLPTHGQGDDGTSTPQNGEYCTAQTVDAAIDFADVV